MSVLKTCSQCKEIKPLSEFSPSSRPGGFKSECKVCACARQKAAYVSDPEKYRIRRVEHYARDPSRFAEAAREYRAAHPELKERLREVKREWTRANNQRLNAARTKKRNANIDQAREKQRNNYAKNRARVLAEQKEYRQRYPEKKRAQVARWVAVNRERKRAVNRAHYAANAKRWRAYAASRKAAKLQATPIWANDADTRAFYLAAPDGVEIDHIVPLQSRLVCGLHWVGNFQYLPPLENRSKRNHFWPDMPEPTGRE